MITALLELYNEGVDHYDKSDQVPYADNYRTKIQDLLNRPDLMSVYATVELPIEQPTNMKRSMTYVAKPKSGMFEDGIEEKKTTSPQGE